MKTKECVDCNYLFPTIRGARCKECKKAHRKVYIKKWWRKDCDNLTDRHIIRCLIAKGNAILLEREDITSELIEVKRKEIQLGRMLKSKKT